MKNNKLAVVVTIIALVALIGTTYLAYDYLTESVSVPQVAATAPATLAPSASDTTEPDTDTEQTTDSEAIMAPDFEVFDVDGNSVHLSDFLGQPVIINYWASWCPPCIAEFPDFEQAYTEYGEDVVFLMINSTDGVRETSEKAIDFIDENGYTMPIHFDLNTDFALTYGFRSLPTTAFISKQGEVVSIYAGLIGKDVIDENINTII